MYLIYQALRNFVHVSTDQQSEMHLTSGLVYAIVLSLTIALTVVLWTFSDTRPMLADPIPFIFNSLQFIFDNESFMNRVVMRLKTVDIAKFYLFKQSVFLIGGSKNVPIVLSRSNKVGLEASWIKMVFPVLYNMPATDVARFANDRSGADRIPALGSEHVPFQQRLWFNFHNIHNEYLSKTQHFRPLLPFYRDRLSAALEEAFPVDRWVDVSLAEFVRGQIATRSIEMLFGPRLFEINPTLLDAFWAFDRQLLKLISLPRWLARSAHQAQLKYNHMIRVYLDDAFSIKGREPASLEPQVETPLQHSMDNGDEAFGKGAHVAPIMLVQWMRDSGLGEESIVGALAVLMFALISNTVPITQWMILEVVRDPLLFTAVRAEVATAYTTNSFTEEPKLDADKIVNLPLLQSIFTETLRMRMNFNIFRDIQDNISLDGFTLRKGEMLQVPMPPAHYDEAIWGVEGHPARDFWAERHIQYDQALQDDTSGKSGFRCHSESLHGRKFVPAGRPSSFFPFGGGYHMCPGRHLAKAEILTTVALLVHRFDIQIIGWTNTDGSFSDRMAQNDAKYSGAGAMPPDRDLKMRWRRLTKGMTA